MLLDVKDLKVSYGNIEALHGISFSVDEGEIVTLIGANGAGKTTTLMTISRQIPHVAELGGKVTGGSIMYQDEDLLEYEPHQVVGKFGISQVPEGRRIFGNLSVLENLRLATYARKDRAQIEKDLKRVFEIFPRLEERRHQRGETLSEGDQRPGHDHPAGGAEREHGLQTGQPWICNRDGKHRPGRDVSGTGRQSGGEESLSGRVSVGQDTILSPRMQDARYRMQEVAPSSEAQGAFARVMGSSSQFDASSVNPFSPANPCS